VVTRDGRSSRECCLRGSGLNDVVGTAGVDMKRDVALVIIEGGRVDDTLKHGPLGVCHLSVKNAQVASLGMTAVPEGAAEGFQVFRPDVGHASITTDRIRLNSRARPSLTIQARKRCRMRPPWLWVTTAISDALASTVAYSVARVWAMSSYSDTCVTENGSRGFLGEG